MTWPATYCTCCKQECLTHEEDHGIGPYEYWGQRCVDRRMVTVSDCCDAEVIDCKPEDDELKTGETK